MENIRIGNYGSKRSDDPMVRFSVNEPIYVNWITKDALENDTVGEREG